MARKQKQVSRLRVRVIVFRDFSFDGANALIASPFFDLPDGQESFVEFITLIRAGGGGDEPESGLEALATAIGSPWVRIGDRRRHVVVLWTDASAHRLEDAAIDRPPGYPPGLPASFAKLTDMWEGQEMDPAAKRLLIYAPDAYPWNEIQSGWENTVHIVSEPGGGLQEIDFREVLDVT
jgi:hypothetical protein